MCRAQSTQALRAHLPGTRRTAGRRTHHPRLHQPGKRREPLHLLRQTGLPMPSRPATTPRPLLPVESRDRGQDGEPATQPGRGRALPGLDRQPSPTRTDHRPDGRDLSNRRRTHPPAPSRHIEPTPNSETLTPTGGGQTVIEKCGTSVTQVPYLALIVPLLVVLPIVDWVVRVGG